ncbi:MAG: TonB-dependent receptor [candidate division KSB1 bacterium]|nr:TonB-dependent receptor [candidate division KSB1 bacterium]
MLRINAEDVLNIHRMGEDKGWRDYTWYDAFQLRGDYTNQITNRHQLKSGFKATLNKMHLDYGRHRWSDHRIDQPPEYWTERNVSYLEVGAYIQDKIEFEGMVMNIGVRMDGFKSFEGAFTDPWSYYYTKGVNYDSLYYAPSKVPPMKVVVSPRLGVSHPITDNAKLFFNYGYFFQRATVEDLYTDIREQTSSLEMMGNARYEFPQNHFLRTGC